MTTGEAGIAALGLWLDDLTVWRLAILALAGAATGACIPAMASRERRETALAAALTATAQIVVGAYLTVGVVGTWTALDTEAMRGASAMGEALMLSAVGALGLAAASLLDAPRLRQVAGALTGALVIAGGLVAGAVGAVEATGADCDRFRFDPERWAAGAEAREEPGELSVQERIAPALIECGTLRDRSRGEVRALLGTPPFAADRGRRSDTWQVGWINDGGIGVGDGTYLVVRYGPDGRVTHVGRRDNG